MKKRAVTSPPISPIDDEFMGLALREACKGLGRTAPNPAVGAVVAKGKRVIAVAHHARAGAPHAEIVALEKAGRAARGATLYVTLEPCNHHGRTPPCTDAILAAGIRRVVAATRDPNPTVKGGGLRRLRAAGLQVEVGLGEAFARPLNRAWFHFVTHRLPFVTLKVAMTADGRLATYAGDSRWITSVKSREMVHRIRDRVDAVLVGAGTVRADNPELTARLPGAHSPLRVILDGRLRTSPRAKVFRPGHVLFSAVDPTGRERRNVEVIRGKGGRVPLGKLLRRLAELEVTHLLVEGGAEVFTEFIERGLWNELILFMAPKLAGPRGIPWFQGRSPARMRDATGLARLRRVSWVAPDAAVIFGQSPLWPL